MPKISADLADDEYELLAAMFHDWIIKHREMATLEHVTGKMSKAELTWCLGHAEYVAEIYKKVFGFPHK